MKQSALEKKIDLITEHVLTVDAVFYGSSSTVITFSASANITLDA